jgi:ABC-type amino acid transport substrate-binding protein
LRNSASPARNTQEGPACQDRSGFPNYADAAPTSGALLAKRDFQTACKFAALLAAAWILILSSVSAAPMQIGIHDKPPFAMKAADGSWTGLAVDVWKIVAADAGVSYEFVEVPFEDIRIRVGDGTLDAAVGEISVSAEDEKALDFTQPYLTTTLGIAMESRHWKGVWLEAISEFLNWTVAQFLMGIFVAMLIVSVVIWLLERRHHTGHFRGGIDGIGSALWFAAVTMTTVGYGDKTPATPLGRFVAICWMFVGVLMVSAFTATVASSMAASRINSPISSVSDFQHLACGVLKGSNAEQLATLFGLNTVPFESLEEALRSLSQKKLQAVLADKISLHYLKRQMARENPPTHFDVPDFSVRGAFLAIPVRQNHPDYARLNESLLKLTSSPEWDGILLRWLGSDRYGL